jgi:hypothetical protein
MADSDNSTTPIAISWRAILKGTGALPPGNRTRAAPTDPVLALWRDWRANHSEVAALTRKWQRIETRLIHSIGFPQIEIRLRGQDGSNIAQSVGEIERLLASASEAEKRKRIAEFKERRRRWDEAAEALGLNAIDAELETAHDKERSFIARIPTTGASSLPGVAAKLAVIIQAGQPSPQSAESPWPELRSTLADLARLTSPEAGVLSM